MPPLDLYARVRFFAHFAHETAGAACTRLSLRPLLLMRAEVTQSPGAVRREIADAYPTVITREVIQYSRDVNG